MKNIIFFLILFFSCNFPNLGPQVKIKEVTSDEVGNKIYLKKEARGLNYMINALSCSSVIDFEHIQVNKNYIFYTFHPIFYKISNGTIYIYTETKSKIPIGFPSKIAVEQIKLSFKELNALETNDEYKKHNLNIFY